jgi:hypothetical protein
MGKMTIGDTRVRRLLDIARATGREWALVVSVVDGRKSVYASPDGQLTHMLEQSTSRTSLGPFEITWEQAVSPERAAEIVGRWHRPRLMPLDDLVIAFVFDEEGRIIPLRWKDVT